jgi:hypothetical protein
MSFAIGSGHASRIRMTRTSIGIDQILATMTVVVAVAMMIWIVFSATGGASS